MKPTLLYILGALCMALPAQGDELADTQRFIDGLIANPPGTVMQQDAEALGATPRQPLAEDQSWLDQLRDQAQARAASKPTPQALYFVSFSIPDSGLKRLVLEADAFGIPATLRGMVKGDLRTTANAVLRLVNEDKRGGVQIDPKAFATYGIAAVPALVVTCEGKFDRLAGNLALRAALTKVAESGECADTARAILAAHPET